MLARYADPRVEAEAAEPAEAILDVDMVVRSAEPMMGNAAGDGGDPCVELTSREAGVSRIEGVLRILVAAASPRFVFICRPRLTGELLTGSWT